MSFVTTAIDQRARSFWQSLRHSMVLPEPTGPPMPMRGGRVMGEEDGSATDYTDAERFTREICAIIGKTVLRNKQAPVRGLVSRRRDVEPWIEPADVLKWHSLRRRDHRGHGTQRLGEQLLAAVLTEAEQFHRGGKQRGKGRIGHRCQHR